MRRLAPDSDPHDADRLQTIDELRQALDRHEFVPHHQALVSLGTGCVTGYEALARWNHPTKGLVPPGVFVPLLEQARLIDLERVAEGIETPRPTDGVVRRLLAAGLLPMLALTVVGRSSAAPGPEVLRPRVPTRFHSHQRCADGCRARSRSSPGATCWSRRR